MRFVSTRGRAPAATLSDAIAAGLAPDGGLYVPERLPRIAFEDCAIDAELVQTAANVLAPFFVDDALGSALAQICAEAFSFRAPMRLVAAQGRMHLMLELFHGPTAAFKDFGARFLAACMRRIPRESSRPLTILVATSGDTGAAVASAFAGIEGFRVVILYPDGRVSPRQAHQLGCFGGNVTALRVAGSFDDCQRLVKQAFADTELRSRVPLSSANSISLGRLLPQMAYYAQAALAHWNLLAERKRALSFIVPTGNLGNAFASVLARECGLPIGRIVLATNANRTLPDFFSGGEYAPRASTATLANAMDVGNPSNFERLRWLYPDADALRREFRAIAVDDEQIRATIRKHYSHSGELLCPHTATAMCVLDRLRVEAPDDHPDWAVVATAHPAKFDSIVEPLIGRPVDLPPMLADLLGRTSHAEPQANDYLSLRNRLMRV